MDKRYGYDYSKLISRMRKTGTTQTDIAKIIEKNVATVSVKLNGHANFTQIEIEKICAFFSIPKEEIGQYFFAH